eukprot:scaffold12470_cov119-Isochrysis_galbana.AAC.13
MGSDTTPPRCPRAFCTNQRKRGPPTACQRCLSACQAAAMRADGMAASSRLTTLTDVAPARRASPADEFIHASSTSAPATELLCTTSSRRLSA